MATIDDVMGAKLALELARWQWERYGGTANHTVLIAAREHLQRVRRKLYTPEEPNGTPAGD